MCQTAGQQSIQLCRCEHGVFHVTVGATTLRLTEKQLWDLTQASNAWFMQHPDVMAAVADGGAPHERWIDREN